MLLGIDCLYLTLTYEPFLTWFAYRFRAEDSLMPSDALVVMLGSNGGRSAEAARLYRQGLAPVILLGQTGDGSAETEIDRQVLMQCGVPAEAIRILPGRVVRGTHDEALRVRDYVQAHPLRRITVVTSAFHTARARWTFRKVLRGTGVDIRMTACRWGLDETNWYSSDDGIKLYVLEIFKIIYYRVIY